MRAAPTYFQRPDRRKATYRALGTPALPRGQTVLQPACYADLGHCLVPLRWKNLVQDVTSCIRANIRADHYPLS
eukprot:6177866-Alexandrium_andersonii.AAC.1